MAQIIKESLGNSELLKLYKTAFLCSRQCPADVILKIYDWAIAQREAGRCVISGFHSKLEKDVLHYLLKGKQPIIIALARGLKETIEPNIQTAIDQGRFLIVTPFERKVKRVTEETALERNKLMMELADEIVVPYANPGGQLAKLLLSMTTKAIQRGL